MLRAVLIAAVRTIARNWKVLVVCALMTEAVRHLCYAAAGPFRLGFGGEPPNLARLVCELCVVFPLVGAYIGVALLASRERAPSVRDFFGYFRMWFGFVVPVGAFVLATSGVLAGLIAAFTQLAVVVAKSSQMSFFRAFYEHSSAFVSVDEFLLVNSPLLVLLAFFLLIPFLLAPVCYADLKRGVLKALACSCGIMASNRWSYYACALMFLMLLIAESGIMALLGFEPHEYSPSIAWFAALVVNLAFGMFNLQLLVEGYERLRGAGADGVV